ncbi:MAG: Ig-like domain-containing protein, partial [Candidatus Absconditabacteria bacterium]|nr:Ig-like domain-containing protein [Candidatus Absconditabacteria bacterium]
ATGTVTAIAAGSATITVKTNDGNKTASTAVTVNTATIPVTGVTLNKSATTLTVGANETLVATVNPSNATDKSVSWSSSNTSVATVSATGTVTAIAAGSATITVKTNDGNKSAFATVTVSTTKDYSWIKIGSIYTEVVGEHLLIRVVGTKATEFTKLFVNTVEVSNFSDGEALVPIQNEMSIKVITSAGVSVEAWYKTQ